MLMPAVFFIVVPVLALFSGKPILSVEEGVRFRIPSVVPWPLNTILGFYTVLAIGVVVLKTAITTREVSLLIHLKEKSAVDRS